MCHLYEYGWLLWHWNFSYVTGRKCHGLHLAEFTTQDIAEYLTVPDDVPFYQSSTWYTIVKSAVQHLIQNKILLVSALVITCILYILKTNWNISSKISYGTFNWELQWVSLGSSKIMFHLILVFWYFTLIHRAQYLAPSHERPRSSPQDYSRQN